MSSRSPSVAPAVMSLTEYCRLSRPLSPESMQKHLGSRQSASDAPGSETASPLSLRLTDTPLVVAHERLQRITSDAPSRSLTSVSTTTLDSAEANALYILPTPHADGFSSAASVTSCTTAATTAVVVSPTSVGRSGPFRSPRCQPNGSHHHHHHLQAGGPGGVLSPAVLSSCSERTFVDHGARSSAGSLYQQDRHAPSLRCTSASDGCADAIAYLRARGSCLSLQEVLARPANSWPDHDEEEEEGRLVSEPDVGMGNLGTNSTATPAEEMWDVDLDTAPSAKQEEHICHAITDDGDKVEPLPPLDIHAAPQVLAIGGSTLELDLSEAANRHKSDSSYGTFGDDATAAMMATTINTATSDIVSVPSKVCRDCGGSSISSACEEDGEELSSAAVVGGYPTIAVDDCC